MSAPVQIAVPAAGDFFEMPTTFLEESGKVILCEPAGSDPRKLLAALLDGTYRKPFVIDDGKTRRLYFTLSYVQSEMLIEAPEVLAIDYTRLMMGFLLFAPRPKHVLIVGLGGGSLTKFCYRQLARSRVTTVEIDADVIALSPLFGVPPADDRLTIVHANATRYLAETSQRADVILLDGCDKQGVAPVFCDQAFYDDVRRRLKPNGLLVMNLVGSNEASSTHVELIEDAFLDRVIVQDGGADGNRIAFAFNEPGFAPDWPAIEREARRLQQQHGLDFASLARKLQRTWQRQVHGRGRRGRS